MPSRRHSADLRGRRQDLGIGVRDMAAGLGIELGRLLAMEDGTAAEDEKDLLSDVAQQHRRLVRRGKASTAKERERRPPIPHSSLARFHQAPAWISQADGMATFDDYPSSCESVNSCAVRRPAQLFQHAPLLRQTVR
jgi:hypothetical protein